VGAMGSGRRTASCVKCFLPLQRTGIVSSLYLYIYIYILKYGLFLPIFWSVLTCGTHLSDDLSISLSRSPVSRASHLSHICLCASTVCSVISRRLRGLCRLFFPIRSSHSPLPARLLGSSFPSSIPFSISLCPHDLSEDHDDLVLRELYRTRVDCLTLPKIGSTKLQVVSSVVVVNDGCAPRSCSSMWMNTAPVPWMEQAATN
jgi:hypothetical protein